MGLGSDGLARVDLRPYASLRPGDAAAPIRWPLAALGAALLAVAAIAAWSPRQFRGGDVHGAQPGSPPVPVAAASHHAHAAHAEQCPRAPALYGGAALFALGAVAAIVATVRLTDPLTIADPWPRMALLAVSSLVWALGCALTVAASPFHWVADWPRPWSARTAPRHLLPRLAPLVAIVPAAAAAVIWWTQRFQTPDATRGALLWLLAILVAVVRHRHPVRLAPPRALDLDARSRGSSSRWRWRHASGTWPTCPLACGSTKPRPASKRAAYSPKAASRRSPTPTAATPPSSIT